MEKIVICFALSVLSMNLSYAQDVKATQPAQVASVEEDEMFIEDEQDLEEADLADFEEA